MSELTFSAEKYDGLAMPMGLVGPGTDLAQLRVTELRRSDIPNRNIFEIWNPLLTYIDADLKAQQPRLDAAVESVRLRVNNNRFDEVQTSMGFAAQQRVARRLAKDGLVDARVKTGVIEDLLVATSESAGNLELPNLRPIATAFLGLRRHYVLLGAIRMGSQRATIASLIEIEQTYDVHPGKRSTAFRAYKPAVKRLAHLAGEAERLRHIRNYAATLEAKQKLRPLRGGLPGTKR